MREVNADRLRDHAGHHTQELYGAVVIPVALEAQVDAQSSHALAAQDNGHADEGEFLL